ECAHAFGFEGRGAPWLADQANERTDKLPFDLVDGVSSGEEPLDALGRGRVTMREKCRVRVLDGGIHDFGIGLGDLRRDSLVDRAYQRRVCGLELGGAPDPWHELRNAHRCPPLYCCLSYTCCPSLSGMSRRVLGANSSSSFTRRSANPCSWVYCSSASM